MIGFPKISPANVNWPYHRRRFGGVRVLPLLSLLCAVVTAHSELVLTHFTTNNLLKVMAVGDSITDDCSIGGAWRAPLQRPYEGSQEGCEFCARVSSVRFSTREAEGRSGVARGSDESNELHARAALLQIHLTFSS